MKKTNAASPFALAALALAVAGALLLVFGSPALGENFPTGTAGLPDAAPTQVVEIADGGTYTITAAEVKKEIGGRDVRMIAYNGSVPGPTLRVPQGATFTVVFKNEADTENTIHWHGVRLANASDGVPDVTQAAVEPGDSFTYTVTVPDAGMYWYHPHVRDDYAIEHGLYGNLWVTPGEGTSWNPVDRELPIFVDDVLLEAGQIAAFQRDGANRTLMGRYGNVPLVNGDDNYVLRMNSGEVARLYLTSSASARPFRIAISGAKVKLVGGDSGLYERDRWADDVTLAPSERAIVEVLFAEAGTYPIENRTPEGITQIGKVVVADGGAETAAAAAFETLRAHPEVAASIDPFRAALGRAPDYRLDLEMSMSMAGMMDGSSGMGGHMMGGSMMGSHVMPDGTAMANGMMGGDGGIEWEDGMAAMNATSDTESVSWKLVDRATGRENTDVEWSFARGDQPVIRIFNDPASMHPMQHPIHFHGQRFLVANRNGAPEANLVWKDTVLVLAGEYVDIVLDASNPGTWMAHCHILEHIEAGMMMAFEVK